MNYDTFFGALYVGYEVEPEYSVGDWVVCDEMKIIGQLVEVDGEIRVDSIDYNVRQSIRLDKLRHATLDEIEEEKERRWFEKHDRKPWELKEGDILSQHGNCRTQIIYRVCPLTKSVKFYGDVEWTRKYEIRSNYLVACFAEDRKDV